MTNHSFEVASVGGIGTGQDGSKFNAIARSETHSYVSFFSS